METTEYSTETLRISNGNVLDVPRGCSGYVTEKFCIGHENDSMSVIISFDVFVETYVVVMSLTWRKPAALCA